jgi:hypothetical protein
MRRTAMRRRAADNHLSGDEWVQVEHALKVRSGTACECCGTSLAGVPREQVEIQHRRAQGMGGTDAAEANSLANLLLLHGFCHRWVESRPSDPRGYPHHDLARVRGLWVPHEYDDGVLVPVDTYPLVLHSGRRVLLDPVNAPYLKDPDEWGYRGPVAAPR